MQYKTQLDERMEKPNVLVVDTVDRHILDALENYGAAVDYSPGISRDAILKVIGGYQVIVGRTRMPIDKGIIDAGEKLRIICRAGVGIENIDTEAAGERGIKVINVPGAATESVVELTIHLIIAGLRSTHPCVEDVKAGKFVKSLGSELAGKTVGIVGFGRIGTRISQVLKAFDAEVIVTDLKDYREKAGEIGVEFTDHRTLYRRSDIVCLHVNMEVNKVPVIGAAEVGMMKDGVMLINTARGKATEMKAVCEGLESGKIGFYGADVMWNEPPKDETEIRMLRMRNVAVTPHIGANTKEAQERIAKSLAEELVIALEGIKGV